MQNIGGPDVNLLAAWLGILVGLGSGAVLGLRFQQVDWLGGYQSIQRRLYRLGHISFFGLALLNLAFFFSVHFLSLRGPAINVASIGFVVGAATMPLCCGMMAHFPRAHSWFVLPVGSLLAATGLTVWKVVEHGGCRP